jgi:hypothetical protein
MNSIGVSKFLLTPSPIKCPAQVVFLYIPFQALQWHLHLNFRPRLGSRPYILHRFIRSSSFIALSKIKTKCFSSLSKAANTPLRDIQAILPDGRRYTTWPIAIASPSLRLHLLIAKPSNWRKFELSCLSEDSGGNLRPRFKTRDTQRACLES